MISFEMSQHIREQQISSETVAREHIRPEARYFDEHEHEMPWNYANYIWNIARKSIRSLRSDAIGMPERLMTQIHVNEMISWGDAGFFLATPWPALGGYAILTNGTEEQKARFLGRFDGEKPTWASMALTESHCGSDSSAIRTRAVQDGDSWVLNGEKLFVTTARMSMIDSDGIMIVWATIDPAAGRAGMRPFVVEANTPGLKVSRLEKKLGIRASDTAVVILEDCRIPLQNMLGSAPGAAPTKGFKGAMEMFDSGRPSASASGLGIARATLDFLKEELTKNGVAIRYGLPRNLLTSIERDIIDMEAQWRAAWLLVLRATWLVDQRKPNTLESSMCKMKAGDVVTKITQKGVELMGTLGYSRRLLLEKWMRDSKVIDLFEGTGQINRLVVARRILGYSGKELK